MAITLAQDIHRSHRLGQFNGQAKLTDADVRAIVRRVQAGQSQSAVARLFCVHRVCVNHILRGRQWTHITSTIPGFVPTAAGVKKGEKHYRHKLTEADVRDIVNRLNSGQSINSVARLYWVAFTTIQSIERGESWKHVTRPEGVAHAG